MMSISGFAHLLTDQWNDLDDDERIQYAQIIICNTDGLAEFGEDVLQVARIEAGEYSYDIRPFEVRSLARNVLDNVADANSERRFEFIATDDLPLVLGDEDRQRQILTNLLSNPIKFSPVEEPSSSGCPASKIQCRFPSPIMASGSPKTTSQSCSKSRDVCSTRRPKKARKRAWIVHLQDLGRSPGRANLVRK